MLRPYEWMQRNLDSIYPTVRDIDGQLVLDDPTARGVIDAVGKHNCRATYEKNRARAAYFAERISTKGLMAKEWVIVVINADDVHGQELSAALMPKADWQPFRDRGEVPFARGLAGRAGIQGFLDIINATAAAKLASWAGVAVVVVDHGVAEIFTVDEPRI